VPDESTHARTSPTDPRAARTGMTEPASVDTPVAIDRVDCTRSDRDGVELRLTGRWLGPAESSGSEPLLVVQVQGRRHRFTPAADGHPLAPGAWEATFRIPPWAQPRHEGQAALWVGTAVVPVPMPGASADGIHRLPPPPALGEARAWPPEVAPPPAEADPARLAEVADPAVETGRTGPLAELLFKESVSALHAELEERSAEVARLQGAVADARSELEARASRQSALESAHGDLRGELQELMGAVTAQRDDYERRLAEAEERAATAEERLTGADAERERLTAERERLTAELERGRADGERAAETERRLQDAERALAAERDNVTRAVEAERARAAAQLADLSAARDAALADAADLRRRLASAASGRQHHAAELSALRDQLAAAQVSREAAAGEVAGLRAELERLGSELAVTREHQSAHGADLGEAQRLLAEARSLSEQLRSGQPPHAAPGTASGTR
jgi:predicted  nucleic acid-binding Zn-ribbon protein